MHCGSEITCKSFLIVGSALLGCQPRSMLMEICYDEEFWKDFEILMYDHDRLENTEKDVNNIVDLLSIKEKENLLDVCCGFGRHSIKLAQKKINVTGIDITDYYLKKAKESVKELKTYNANPTFLKQDLLKFNEKNSYDYAINMFTSFGLLNSEEDEITGLENVYRSLKDGGKYLIDIQGKELLCRDYEKNIWFESGDTKVFLEYTILNCFTTLRSRWLYYKNNKMFEKTFDTRIYSAIELATLLSEIGFKTVEIFGDLEGNPYDYNAKRLIAVATK